MKKLAWLWLIIFILGMKTQLYSHGSAVHIGMYNKVLQYYLTNYGQNNPYYQIIRDYPEYVKFGAILPDMNMVNSGKPVLQELYDKVQSLSGQPLSYEIKLNRVPDPDNPYIGTNSFGIDTHDSRYALVFAQYLLDQANLADPPGIDPGGTGTDAVSRAQKLALAFGYYLHLCQDISAHNYWIPKLTAESGLAELSLVEPDDPGTNIEVIPGNQTHNAIEILHDYRSGLFNCQDVANTLLNDFWYCAGSSGIPVQVLNGTTITGQFEPWAGPVYYPASSNGSSTLYEGLNPALHFFYEVLKDWHQNNPMGLTGEHTSGPLISLLGFIEECHMWRFLHRFYPSIVGHDNFNTTFATWVSNHTYIVGAWAQAILDFVNYRFTFGLLGRWLRDEIYNGVVNGVEQGASTSIQSFIGLMKSDPSLADQLATDSDSPINYSEYCRLKNNALFTDPNYFDGFTYYEDLGVLYFAQIGPGGYLYSDWAPSYFNAYHWGVINSLNGYSTYYQQRSDIGVFDVFFTVNGQRYGPGINIVPIQGNTFTAIAELYAFENMSNPIQITAKVKLDHNSGFPDNDLTVKTISAQMQQNPENYNTTQRMQIEIPFSGNDVQSINLEDYRGAYIELLASGNPFFSTDWKQYASMSQIQGNRRYEPYDTYTSSPYSYPQNYLYFSFTNMDDNYSNIGGTININGQDINSNNPVSFFYDESVEATAEEIILWNNDNYKHHDWNENYVDFLRYKSFVACNSPQWTYDIHFKTQDNVNINSQGGDLLQLGIKDPWWVEKSGPNAGQQLNRFHFLYEELGFNGEYHVFLDHPYNPEFPNRPYYQFRASDHDYNNIHWYFQRWQGTNVLIGDENASKTWVSFQNEGANLRAVYKGHLVSNSSEATAANNSRHIISDPNSAFNDILWHAVYEDDGQIYYTYFEDQGNDWSPEFLVSDSIITGYSCKSAGIASYTRSINEETIPKTVIGVVWEMDNGTNTRLIGCRVLDEETGWGEPFYTFDISDYELQPVIEAASDRNTLPPNNFYILYTVSSENRTEYSNLNLSKIDYSNGEYYFDTPEPLYSSTSHILKNPSVTSFEESDKVYFCWQQNSRIKYSFYDVENDYFPEEPIWISPEGNEGSSDSRPSICGDGMNNNKVHIAWQHFDGEMGIKFRHQGFSATNPYSSESPVHQVSVYFEDVTSPSIGSYAETSSLSSTVRISGETYQIYYDSTNYWELIERGYDGEAAGVNKTGENIMAVWTDNSQGLPYLIRDEILNPLEEKSNLSGVAAEVTRERIINLENIPRLNLAGKISFSLGNIRMQTVNGQYPWAFYTINDSIAAGNFLKTRPFKVTDDINSLQFTYKIKAWDIKKPSQVPALQFARINIANAHTALPLQQLVQLNLNQLSPNQYLAEDTVTIDLRPFKGQTIRLEFLDISHSLQAAHLKSVLIQGKTYYPGSPKEILGANENQTGALPGAFSLNQNYPNPFNPTTTLSFDLPQAAPVVLEIYDVTGRHIRTLLNRPFPAGSHSVKWDGLDQNSRPVASGLYVYRIQAGEHIASGKMLLMK